MRKRITVQTESSFIAEVSHDQRGKLTVRTHEGGVYHYRAPVEVVRQFQRTNSPGKLFNTAVRGKYPRFGAQPEPEPEPSGVVDLMAALKASLR